MCDSDYGEMSLVELAQNYASYGDDSALYELKRRDDMLDSGEHQHFLNSVKKDVDFSSNLPNTLSVEKIWKQVYEAGFKAGTKLRKSE